MNLVKIDVGVLHWALVVMTGWDRLGLSHRRTGLHGRVSGELPGPPELSPGQGRWSLTNSTRRVLCSLSRHLCATRTWQITYSDWVSASYHTSASLAFKSDFGIFINTVTYSS